MNTSSLHPKGTQRVAVYLRVSTGRQAEADLSLPDQLNQARAYCDARGWTIASVFEDAGASGTDEDRPAFQRMIAAATAPEAPFDVVLVHSTSRFARDLYMNEMYVRRLRRARVDLVSITQDIAGHDGSSEVLRQMLAVFDEHQSRENAKHTHRAMRENARQGFWNGSRPPFGYQSVDAGRQGHRLKKVLAVDDTEAAVVRRVFRLHLGSEGLCLGVKAIAARLNAEGASYRGKPFSISNVHRILTRDTYTGRLWFDRVEARTGRVRPRDQWIEIEVPVIVPPDVFERVQQSLAARSPRQTPPRVVTGPVLLTGLAVCVHCGGGMTLRTGKSGRYRYYTCATQAHRGKTLCAGQSFPMADLDAHVVDNVTERVLRPERLAKLLESYLAASVGADAERQARMARLKAEVTEASGAKARLLKLVAKGVLGEDDPELAQQLREIEDRRLRATDALATLAAQARTGHARAITPAKIERIAAAIREGVTTGAPEFRRAWLRLFVGSVSVSPEEIRISGPTEALAQLTAMGSLEGLPADGSPFHCNWRPVGDSNPCYRRERAVS